MPIVGASLRGIPASCYDDVSPRHQKHTLVKPYLQLCEREPTTSAHAAVVFDGRAAHDGS